MRSTFFNLDPGRRKKLLDLCIHEFAEKGYELASTNTIVRESGIAKGSFFKYFDSKESVYLYLVKCILEELGELQGPRFPFASTDILVRVEELFTRYMEYAHRSPARYRFILRALLDSHSPLHGRVAAIREDISKRTSGHLYDGVDWTMYRCSEADLSEFLRCLDLGLRHAAMQSLGKKTGIKAFETYITQRFALARRVLAGGIYVTQPE